MARYIDADKLKLSLLTLQNTLKACDFINGVGWVQVLNEAVDLTQTADVQEVKHGEWDVVADYDASLKYGVCSVCGGTAVCDEYCGKCGAKMDSEEAQNDA